MIGAIYLCKSILLAVASLAVATYALNSQKYAPYSTYLLLVLLPIAGQTFQPVWFFEGIERMFQITLFTILSRLLYLGMVLSTVAGPDDYEWVVIANGISLMAGTAMGLGLMARAGYAPTWPGWRDTWQIFRTSAEFFWSRVAVSTYTAGGAVFLGLFSSGTQLAYYAAAEQLYKGAQSLFAPFSQALYPSMVRNQNFPLLFRVMQWSTLACVLVALTGVLLGPWLLALLFGETFAPAFPVLIIFLITLVCTTPSVLLGYPFLGALGKSGLANRSVIVAGGFQLALLFICYLLGLSHALAIACTVMLVEMSVLLLRTHWGRIHYAEWQTKKRAALTT